MSEALTEIDYEARIQRLEERIAELEQKLILVGDIDRFKPLQELLAAKKFKEADLETSRLILEIIGCKDKDALKPDQIKHFPCNPLKVINRLWLMYSEGRFGYSVQASIYQKVGGSLETLQTQDMETFTKFGDQVGWRVNKQWQGGNYNNWDFSLNAPRGCFPAASWKSAYGLKMVTYFLTRLCECDL